MLYLVHPFASSRHFTHREACHWIRGSLLSPMNPVPLPPQGETRALRDWLSVSYSMISVLVISRYAAPPYPAAPDFPHSKPFGFAARPPVLLALLIVKDEAGKVKKQKFVQGNR